MAEYEDPDRSDASGDDELLTKLRGWFREDHEARLEWAKEAEADYGWSAPGGEDQWDEADRLKLQAASRPCVTFNRILPVIQSVCGMEINDRKEVKFIPRTTQNEPQGPVDPMTGQPMPVDPNAAGAPGADDSGPAETLSAAAAYLRDQCDAEDEESDAFQDTVTCGMGWVETRIDYEDNPDGDLREDRIDPLEMLWDAKANKRNLIDARRVWRVREIDKEDAKNEFNENDLSKLDASWARLEKTTEPHDREAARNYENTEFDANRKTVTLVECQWWETRSVWKAANPATGESMEVSKDQIKNLRANAKAAGVGIEIARHNKKVYRTAIIGGEILEEKESQSQKCFKFQCITGYRDRNNKQWVGLVRSMRDPQKWANALFSSVLHQIQVSGKGVMMEKDAVDNVQQAERDWSNASKIVWLKTGSLGQHPKVKQKDQNSIPSGTFDLMQFALGAFRDVTGVNVELMGATDRDQAASLEYQRRQAATTILAPFFDGLRRYRKDNGRLILDLIRNYLSDGRLVRVVGPDYEKYVPLIKDDDTVEYDIIIDESATSPNQKEASWAILQNILPVFGKNLTGSAAAVLLKASPLPLSVVNEFKDATEKDSQNAGPSPDEMKLQMQAKQQEFDMAASAQKAELDSAKMQADLQIKGVDLQIALATLEQEKLKTAVEFQMAQINAGAAVQQRDHDMQMQRSKMQGEALDRESEMMLPQMPAMVQGIGEGLQAMAAAIAQSNQAIASAMAQIAVGQASVSQALMTPKVAQLSADGLTAVVEPASVQ
jgi:hypothetical protein